VSVTVLFAFTFPAMRMPAEVNVVPAGAPVMDHTGVAGFVPLL
jgi:hypothetical protein